MMLSVTRCSHDYRERGARRLAKERQDDRTVVTNHADSSNAPGIIALRPRHPDWSEAEQRDLLSAVCQQRHQNGYPILAKPGWGSLHSVRPTATEIVNYEQSKATHPKQPGKREPIRDLFPQRVLRKAPLMIAPGRNPKEFGELSRWFVGSTLVDKPPDG
ncbi:MAG TPA: hypothetical protein VE218_10495, partial [Acidobacteriaceae bacterium]|nr:hypothetical protein [Acidobacteriaceae bacterium]